MVIKSQLNFLNRCLWGSQCSLAQNEEDKQARAKEFYDVISKFEVMVATPTLIKC